MKKFFMLVLAFFGLTTLFATCNMNVDAVSEVKTMTITAADLGISGYSNGSKQLDCNGTPVTIDWIQLMASSDKPANIQGNSKKHSILYNSSALPGNITEISLTMKEAKNNINVYFNKDKTADKEHIEEVITTNDLVRHIIPKESNVNYFALKWPKSAAYIKEIKISYIESSTPIETAVVTFNANGGSLVEDINTVVGSKLSNLPVPTKEGLVFDGWYKEETLTTKWNEETDVVTGNITLYAKWVELPYITINTLEQLESAEYYFGAKEGYASSYSDDRLNIENDINKAIRFKIYKISEGKVIVSFENNGKTNYILQNTKPNIIVSETLSDKNLLDIELFDGNLALKASNGRYLGIAESKKYFRFYGDSKKFPTASFHKIKDSSLDINEFYMSFVETKASLKLDYKVDTLEATDVDLRFGTIVDKTLYNANAKYGVVAVKSTSNINLTQGLQDATNIADFVAKNQGAKNVEATPVEVANGYQFAWVINNIEEQELKYNEEFIAAVYMELDGKLYFATPKTASVLSVRDTYINDKLDIPANVLEVLKKLA